MHNWLGLKHVGKANLGQTKQILQFDHLKSAAKNHFQNSNEKYTILQYSTSPFRTVGWDDILRRKKLLFYFAQGLLKLLFLPLNH